jgi:deferrochelatase/peroxidase EfeB
VGQRPIRDQQQIFGRTKQDGAPLGGKAEFDTPDFAAKAADGKPVIDPLSHIGLAARENFIRLQNRLGANDLLNEYIHHIGSAIFAVPPAPTQGHYIGQSLFS